MLGLESLATNDNMILMSRIIMHSVNPPIVKDVRLHGVSMKVNSSEE
jgi:hypothetical protein